MYEYRAKIIEVYDGDTVTSVTDCGFDIHFTMQLRLFGINTPEVRGDQKEAGTKSRDALRKLILGKDVKIKTYKDKKEKYGRYLADIFIDVNGTEICVNNWLVEKGFAVYHKY